MATLTKKHFKAIAEIVRDSQRYNGRIGITDLIGRLSGYFAYENPNFNANKFKEACSFKFQRPQIEKVKSIYC